MTSLRKETKVKEKLSNVTHLQTEICNFDEK